MNVYLQVHPAYTQQIFYTQTTLVFESFRQCGAIVTVGDEFRSIKPEPDDHLVVYGRHDDYIDIINKFLPEHRWNYVVDESSGESEPYDVAIKYMTSLNIKNLVVTYQNEHHLNKLKAVEIKYVISPQCVPMIRPLAKKTNDVLISGQLVSSVYPERSRVAHALRVYAPFKTTATMDYPMTDATSVFYGAVGEDYSAQLDRFRMGVTCCVGKRDRFVAKYVELGASHALPIGDCPSYMSSAMKRAMVDTRRLSKEQIAAEVMRLLAEPWELLARTETFTAEVAANYLSLPNIKRVIDEIKHST